MAKRVAGSLEEVLSALKARIQETDPHPAHASGGGTTLFLDVREADELAGGIIPGSLHISRGFLELSVEEEVPQKDRPLVVYCAGGTRSLFAAAALESLGYSHVKSLSGGFNRWKELGLPTEIPSRLSADQRSRYSRHLLLKEVGEQGQLKLGQSRVLIVGAGGLGSPSAYYLAAAGVGTLGLVDFDLVEESNLQRQILHTTARVGKPKVESARETLSAFNPLVQVQTHRERIESSNVDRIIQGYELVLDASDNFQTRYLLNDACYKHGLPLVHGSILSFEGNLSVFDFRTKGPCYRCLYPERPSEGFAPNCSEAGVLGVLPGVIGTVMAAEALKTLLGIGSSLSGRLLHYDALASTFDEFEVQRDPACRLCSKPKEQINYELVAEVCS